MPAGRPGWKRWRPLAEVLFGALVIATQWGLVDVGPQMRIWQLALAAGALIAFLVRRRLPRVAAVAGLILTAAAWWLGLTVEPFVLAGACVMEVAERGGTVGFRRGYAALGAALLLIALTLGTDGPERQGAAAILGAIVVTTAWVLGERTRRMRVEEARRARAEERLALAREAHDVLSHSLGTIGVQAGVLAQLRSASTADLRAGLSEIEHDARAAADELRVHLGEIRAGAAGSRIPLDVLIDVVARAARRAGLDTDIEVADAARDLPDPLQSTAHRIAQEAVTNIIRHAHAGSCRISVSVDSDHLVVEIADDGEGDALAPEGNGIRGMRERAETAGGSLTVRSSDVGTTVRAVLPVVGRR